MVNSNCFLLNKMIKYVLIIDVIKVIIIIIVIGGCNKF